MVRLTGFWQQIARISQMGKMNVLNLLMILAFFVEAGRQEAHGSIGAEESLECSVFSFQPK